MHILFFLALAALVLAGPGAPAGKRSAAGAAAPSWSSLSIAQRLPARSVFGGDSPSSRTAPMVITGSTKSFHYPECMRGGFYG